jgi:hypothetical protein
MGVSRQLIFEGKAFNIYDLLENNKSYFNEFLLGLTKELKPPLIKQIEWIAENGPPKNKEKFNYEGDQIYAIKKNKKNGNLRVYCFFDEGKIIILTNGVFKQKNKANPEVLKKAKRLREKYFKAREENESA